MHFLLPSVSVKDILRRSTLSGDQRKWKINFNTPTPYKWVVGIYIEAVILVNLFKKYLEVWHVILSGQAKQSPPKGFLFQKQCSYLNNIIRNSMTSCNQYNEPMYYSVLSFYHRISDEIEIGFVIWTKYFPMQDGSIKWKFSVSFIYIGRPSNDVTILNSLDS